jgi:nicotinate-nucleotide--dimethylbenzimidazole phosphoribosyltransferase
VSPVSWPRPVPTVGDATSAAERAGDPQGWQSPPGDREALARIVLARRDVRRYRPDAVAPDLLRRVLAAAHAAPSVGHSQPWRFVVVRDPLTRQRAATMADEQRLAQAAGLDDAAGRQLLDLDLEGIREAPVGVVVCCDRRAPAAGVLGRATFGEADMWSCACAIENLWLTARAEGLGVGWVTLFRPDDLAALVRAPAGVTTLGWLCLGWPDERPPAPGLERRGWSRRLPLDDVVLHEGWDAGVDPAPPDSRLAAGPGPSSAAGIRPPSAVAVVTARDGGDDLLTVAGSLGVLDRVVDRVGALGQAAASGGTVVLVAADHAVTRHGVSAYPTGVTRHVAEAALLGESLGAVAAGAAGLGTVVGDAGGDGPPVCGALLARPGEPGGDLVTADGLRSTDADALVDFGRRLGARLAPAGLVVLGEVGVGNTTVAAALAAVCLGLDPAAAVGLGAGADRPMLDRKIGVVAAVVDRLAPRGPLAPLAALAAAGGGDIAVLTGVTLGAAAAGAAVVLDGLATSVAALLAVREEPAVAASLIAGQRSREAAHPAVLAALGLEPLLDLRIRAGEGAGAALAAGLVLGALRIRARTARVAPVPPG